MSIPIWTKFSRIRNGKELKFRIQEVQSDKYRDVWDLFLNYYVTEEPVHKAADLIRNQEAMIEYEKIYCSEATLNDYQVDACYLENDLGELTLVAGSIMYMDNEADRIWNGEEIMKESKTENLTKFLKMVVYMYNFFGKKLKKTLNITSFYEDIGLTVHPDYRGIGIAGELFKARMVTCKQRGVPMTGAWMTSFASQKAVDKLGWKTFAEISYTDLGRIGDVTFDGVPPSAKYMIAKV